MTLRVHLPSYPLDQYIGGLVYYDGLHPTHDMDRFLPDGNTELIIDLTEHPQHIYDNETLQVIQTCRQAWVSGVRTQPITIPSGKGSRMLIVAFRKGGAWPFYPLPMSELTDTVLDADLVFGRGILELREQLLASPSAEAMFLITERFLLGRAAGLLEADTPARCVDFALSNLIQRPDGLSLRRLSDQVGYSQKHFINLFKGRVGVAPKQYMGIMRFQSAIRELEACTSVEWSQLARRTGFYDQAHLIQDFRRYSGLTPAEYLRRKSNLLNYIPVR